MDKELAKAIRKTHAIGGTVFVGGNGGSAATAEHFTNDLLSRRIKAICLNSNVSVITMIANDYGYRYIFSKQLDVLCSPYDLVVLISCSGTSPNILEVMKHHINIFSLFGGKGTYEDMETQHLDVLHETVKLLGPKSL
jgi:D-sedoheptulose 7-phosphate isomerase